MALIPVSKVHAALDRAAAHVLRIVRSNRLVDTAALQAELERLDAPERRLTEVFLQFTRRNHAPDDPFHREEIEEALAYAKTELIDRYDLENDGLSQQEIDQMSTLGQLAVALALTLKEAAGGHGLHTAEEWIIQLRELSACLVYVGHASESEEELEPVYVEAALESLTAEAFSRSMGLDPDNPREAVTISHETPYLLDPAKTTCLTDINGTTGARRANAANEFAALQLRDLHSFVIGQDDSSTTEHEQYLVGLTAEGHIAGYRTRVKWT